MILVSSKEETLEDPCFTDDSYGVAEECYARSAAQLGSLLSTVPAPAAASTAAATRLATRSASTVEVATFSGKFTDWLKFEDLFEAIVIKAERISFVEKLQTFRMHVRGEASDMIKKIQVVDANFESA